MKYTSEFRGQMWRVINQETGLIARMPDRSIPEATVPVDGGGFTSQVQADSRAMELNDTYLKTGNLENSPTDPGIADA